MARRPYAPSTDGSRKVSLAKLDTDGSVHLRKEAGLAEAQNRGAELAQPGHPPTHPGQHTLPAVFQGRDASGKDGAIRKILEFSNIQNAAVVPFKVPTEEECAHDFLWRVHRAAPARGHNALYNRSHYEDVIAARVHKLVPEPVWK